MNYYRAISLVLACCFAAVGVVFLVFPNGVLRFFNLVSPALGLPEARLTGYSLYLILAAGYMYIVTVLAGMMYRFPEERLFPLLLVHAKSASSLLSLLLFVFQSKYLVYAANFLIDGAIALLVLFLYYKMKRTILWASL